MAAGEEGEVRRGELKAHGSPWSVTAAALEGLAKASGRYLQAMCLLPAVAPEAHAGIVQLVKLYLYSVRPQYPSNACFLRSCFFWGAPFSC